MSQTTSLIPDRSRSSVTTAGPLAGTAEIRLPAAGGARPPLRQVIIGGLVLGQFLNAARARYASCTPATPPSCFAVLVGTVSDSGVIVARAEYGRNVRGTDSTAVSEFSTTIAETFGAAYRNRHRGFWCDSADLLRIHNDAEADGLSILGSIHMHPDWHRIGPPGERTLRISERPTPMDEYAFAMTGWQVNMICYLERSGSRVVHTLAAWHHPGASAPRSACTAVPVQVRGAQLAGVPGARP